MSLLRWGCFLALSQSPLHGQASEPNTHASVAFKASAHTVVLDVVVTGKDGQPVHGLRREDFQVAEDGRRQTITSFEEHTRPDATLPPLPDLPANVFSNIPRVKPTDSVNVLLLDSLNTEIQNQSYVRSQLLKYLRELQPGRRMAVFALGARLRFIQGFTDDPAILARVIDGDGRALPQASPLLKSTGESAAEQQALEQMSEGHGAGAAGLRQFLEEETAARTDQRVLITLEALQQLGRYLAGIPGRKNVIWFSGSFPLHLFPDSSLGDSFSVERSYDEQLRKTDDILTAAEVAIYPISAEGLATDTLNAADQLAFRVHSAFDAQQQQSRSLHDDFTRRGANQATMDQLANETGGEAFYNTNGLNAALSEVVEHGSRFYTLAYSPTNTTADGRFRKLKARVTGGDYKLAYRRGYYAADGKGLKPTKAVGDPLHSYMSPGMPVSTQIPFAMRVLRSQAAGSAPVAGDNSALPERKKPSTRYGVDFVIALKGLQLETDPDGSYHGSVESNLVVYDREGRPLNWLVRQVDLDMDAARFALVQQNGVGFHLEIDAPQEAVSLRGGVYDRRSGLAGTVEIPVSSELGGPPAVLK